MVVQILKRLRSSIQHQAGLQLLSGIDPDTHAERDQVKGRRQPQAARVPRPGEEESRGASKVPRSGLNSEPTLLITS